jgi:magnesium transporter
VIRTVSWLRDGTTDGRPTNGLASPPPGGWVWVDITGESETVIRETCSELGVDEVLVDEAIEQGSLPMIAERRDLLYVVLNVFGVTPEGRLRAREVDLFVGPDFLLSVHDAEMVSTSTVMNRLGEGVDLRVSTPAGLLAYLAMAGARRVPALIDTLEDQLEELEELAMAAEPRTITEVHALRRDMIVMRKVLVPQRQIFDELAETGHNLVDEASRRDFARVADFQTQILESVEAARSLLTSVLETHRGAVADQTNEIVRVLTVFSAILLPLALVTGVYGMNFIEIPLAAHRYGFWILLGLMALAGVTLWLYFGRRGFVGAPRLSELPRAVGLGLYHVGTAPIRIVADGIESTIRRVGLGEPGDHDKEPTRPE